MAPVAEPGRRPRSRHPIKHAVREYPASKIDSTYIVEAVLIVILVVIELVVIILIEALVLESLAREVVNGAGDDLHTRASQQMPSYETELETHLLLQILTDLIVNLELVFDRLELILLDVAALNRLLRWGSWW